MKFGLFVPQGWRLDLVEIEDPVEQFEAMTNVARAADGGDWDSIWVYDHFHTVPTSEMESTFECWTTTATLSRDTKRVNIGQMVSCNGYRQPSLYAKIASTVDVASNGRLYAGLGAGWYEQEWNAYGYDWEETPERMGKFREAVEIVHKMWTEDAPVFEGKHYRIDKPINEPKGVRKPHPMFWIGGGGERVTLKLVAQYGDGSNINAELPEIERKLAVLRAHCESVGRDYGEIAKSSTVSIALDPRPEANRKHPRAENVLAGTIADVRERVEQLAAIGVDYVIFYVEDVAYDLEKVHKLNEEVVRHFS
ncbi:LLM class F420-dependent oxidoreductase [soil metagenome]